MPLLPRALFLGQNRVRGEVDGAEGVFVCEGPLLLLLHLADRVQAHQWEGLARLMLTLSLLYLHLRFDVTEELEINNFLAVASHEVQRVLL